MFKFDNTHIFTGYLKQLLSSVNIPMCRIYTKDFAEHLVRYGKEDPRVIESFDPAAYVGDVVNISKQRIATRVNYLKANELYNYFWEYSQNSQELGHKNSTWKRASTIYYNSDKNIPGLTRVLNSPGNVYDTTTHEYLGDYLRFMRDYYNINLMSLYNCFNNKICNNIYYKHTLKTIDTTVSNNISTEEYADYSSQIDESDSKVHISIKNVKNTEAALSKNEVKYKNSYSIFDSQDSKYRIYAFPVKLFYDYTIAIDCSAGIEMFCGLYTSSLETTDKGIDLITKTYKKINKTLFNQPFLYDALNVKYWNFSTDTPLVNIEKSSNRYPRFVTDNNITRWDIANREQDLKLFIKVPAYCKSSIVVLEGDFRHFNDTRYAPPGIYNPDGTVFDEKIDNKELSKTRTTWEYKQNHSILNFNNVNTQESKFTPIGKLQLLAFNTGESYPFADRLVEYLCNSAITPIDEIADNIKRAQRVMSQNNHYFKIEGIWEDKMQKIIYDYMINAGPIKVENEQLIDKRIGYHPRLGYSSRSTLYDVLGYVDKDAEKWYASWINKNNQATVQDTIQNVDIYDGLYDI